MLNLSLPVAVMLALIHLYIGRIPLPSALPERRWLSLAGGVSVTYIFLDIFPLLGRAQGLASILFVLLVLDHANLIQESLVFNTVIVTVALSVLLHGIIAMPGVNAYVAALKACKRRGDDLSSEQKTVAGMPLRYSPNFERKNGTDID